MGPPGHMGVGLAAKAVAPKAPLWALLVASETLDLLCFGFMALGIERQAVTQTDWRYGVFVLTPGSVPWSHGLLMGVVWCVLAGGIAYFLSRDRRIAIAVGVVVSSHWVLDFIVHPPDLPLLLGDSPWVGLGLWSSGPGLMISAVLEFLLLGSGLAIYLVAMKRMLHQVVPRFP